MSEEQEVLERCEQLVRDHDPAQTDAKSFLGAQFDAGLAWVHFPEGFGGLGSEPPAPARRGRTTGQGARARCPTAATRSATAWAHRRWSTHGSDAQRARYLRPLFTGEEIWCQLFSEPGAGSDVASLATTAVRDGDEWIVNGQKVWTTLAHLARWGMLIARTDPDAPKHKGMTYFVIDMHDPGVDVRPLRQMTGEAEFNEVFMTDVRIPDAERLGDVGEGWRVSLTTLMNERVSIGGAIPPREGGIIRMALDTWRSGCVGGRGRGAARPDDAAVDRGRGAAPHQHPRLAAPLEGRTRARRDRSARSSRPSTTRRSPPFVVDLMGAEGMLYTSYEMVRPTATMHWDCMQKAFLRMRANSIEGGTTEVMKNILGERVLGSARRRAHRQGAPVARGAALLSQRRGGGRSR